ncbi:MAG: SGNH hydrolase domain-containing protein [Solirubrobacteraceae bacterium]
MLTAILLLSSFCAAASAASDLPEAHFDAAEGRTPLDLIGVRLGQTASTDLTLVIRTYRPWESSIISPASHRTLCILLRSDIQANPAGRLCFYPSATADSGLGLRYTVLDQTGAQLGIRDLPDPVVVRPSKTTVRVSFSPALLRLKPGLYHWRARSQHSDDKGCAPPAGCEDLLPNAGEIDLNVALSAAPEVRRRCFGAASRDARVRCSNRKLAREVVPAPDDAVLTPNLPCSPLRPIGLVTPCEFGVPATEARNTVALIGDSHAAHWRAALETVAQELGWRGLSVTRSGCPFTKATPRLDPSNRRAQCVRWNSQVLSWLRGNPQVSTVFVVAHFDAHIVVKRGQREFTAKMSGFRRTWSALPPSVKRVVVIRDTPRSGSGTLTCVRRAMAKRRRPGSSCARPRKSALSRDPAVSAAHRLRARRFRTVDMTSFFCSRRQCFPVVGGALVYKDVTHLTDVFASSLGPYLLRKLRALDIRA